MILALSGPGGGVLSTTVLDLSSGVPVDFTFTALAPAGLSQLMFALYGSDRDMMVAPPPFLGFTSYADSGVSVYCSPGPSLFLGAVGNCSVTLGSDPVAIAGALTVTLVKSPLGGDTGSATLSTAMLTFTSSATQYFSVTPLFHRLPAEGLRDSLSNPEPARWHSAQLVRTELLATAHFAHHCRSPLLCSSRFDQPLLHSSIQPPLPRPATPSRPLPPSADLRPRSAVHRRGWPSFTPPYFPLTAFPRWRRLHHPRFARIIAETAVISTKSSSCACAPMAPRFIRL